MLKNNPQLRAMFSLVNSDLKGPHVVQSRRQMLVHFLIFETFNQESTGSAPNLFV
jgi:hypothetical protein